MIIYTQFDGVGRSPLIDGERVCLVAVLCSV